MNRAIALLGWFSFVVLSGVALAALWVVTARPAAYVITERGAELSEDAAGDQVHVVVVYVVIGAVFAAVTAAVLGIRRAEQGWILVPYVVVTTLAAAGVTWICGTTWGPAPVDRAAVDAASAGDRLELPLSVGSVGPALIWPLVATAVLLVTLSFVRVSSSPLQEQDVDAEAAADAATAEPTPRESPQ